MVEVIYHITAREHWRSARPSGAYRAESLASEGFIHCSLRRQVVTVANALYRGRPDLVLLEIDPQAVTAAICYEGEPERFPHIYGPLNLNAVMRVIDFPPEPDGTFAFPDDIA